MIYTKKRKARHCAYKLTFYIIQIEKIEKVYSKIFITI